MHAILRRLAAALLFAAAAALEAAGRKPGTDGIVVSVNGTRDALQAIIDGKLLATVETNPRFGPKRLRSLCTMPKAKRSSRGW